MSEKKTLPLRSELAESDCWDLTPLYADDAAWEADFRKLDSALDEFLKYRGRLGESPEILRAALEEGDRFARLEEKLYVYAHLRHDEDTSNAHYTSMKGRMDAKGAEIGGKTAWFDPELMAIDPERFASFRKSPVLTFYKRTLDETERERPHTLSEKEERILSLSSDVFGTSEKAFSMMNDADMRFPKIRDSKGRSAELTHGSYRKFMESRDRAVRRRAFRSLHKTFGAWRNTFASLLEATVKTNVLSARLRNYPDTLTMALSGANIPPAVYDSLIEAVHAGLPVYHDYFAYRAKLLGLKKLEMWDIQNTIIASAPEARYSWEDAVLLVKEACRPLGGKYLAALEKAFSERWIDIRECRGKRSGAYSSGCYDSNPYLLLNFNGTLDSVSTLAHELGHSMHSYFSNTAQQYHYASYHIFAAEIASTCNELLLNHYLAARTDNTAFKAYLLNQLLDDFRGTLFRQTMFAEFERDIYRRVENGEVLTADLLCGLYADLNARYHGPAVHNTPEIQYEWARIPHFHYGFYVYQYATGVSAAAAFAKHILAGDTEPYLRFLSAGDSKDVIDIIREAGVDFSTPAPVESAIELFGKTLSSLKSLEI